jgi:hypothetical protein
VRRSLRSAAAISSAATTSDSACIHALIPVLCAGDGCAD